MRIILVLLLIVNVWIVRAQNDKWVDSVYSKIRNPRSPAIDCVQKIYKKNHQILKKQVVELSYNLNGNTRFLFFEYYGYNGELNDKVTYSWSITYDTLLLFSFAYIDDSFGITEDFSFYQKVEDESNLGSVKIHTYYKNGKKIREEYAAGEKWADLPYDPDSLFFELPKMLKLGDSILRVKHKYPRPE
jgi:hypothetical protein